TSLHSFPTRRSSDLFLVLLRGISRNDRRKHLRLEGSLTGKLPKMIDARVAGNLVNPGAEGRSGAVTLAVFQNAKEDLLDEVFARSEEHTSELQSPYD